MTSSATLRARLLATASLTLVAAAGLSGCNIDSPLGASAERRGVLIGDDVVGTVENPDGEITVTLASADTERPRPGSNSTGAGVVACDYDSSEAAFSCPTTDLAEGLYRVEVTDAKFAGEGTKLVTVAVTDDAAYDPRVVVSADYGSARLEGWMPGREVTVFVNDDSGRTRRAATVTPDAAGNAAVTLRDGAGRGYAAVLPTDGLWDERSAQGWDRVFVELP